jgi:hypothetical protein
MLLARFYFMEMDDPNAYHAEWNALASAERFWARAKEADEKADQAQDAIAKRLWRETAAMLRAMAVQSERKAGKVGTDTSQSGR